MMWAFLCLAGIELVVVHLLVAALLDWRVALALSLVTAPGVLWIVALLRSMPRHPVTIGSDAVTFRVGRLRCVEVPLASIAGIRRHWEGEALKRDGIVNLALLAYPNLLIEIDPPVPSRRGPVVGVAHKLDAPDAFMAALKGVGDPSEHRQIA